MEINRSFSITLLLCFLGSVSSLCFSCSDGPRIVPDDELKAIITEALISDAVIDGDRKKSKPEFGGLRDTIDYYAPIVRKYGYTASDVRFTIATMASRKSNPLSGVLKDVAAEIKKINQTAEYHYNAYLKFDTLALNYYRDTVYLRDTTIYGRLAKFKILLRKPQDGIYTINLKYNTMDGENDYRRSKSINYRVSAIDELAAVSSTHYIIRSRGKELPYRSEVTVPYLGADSLLVTFNDQIADAEFKDTSYIRDIVVTYTPPTIKARKDYYITRTGFTQELDEYYEKRFFAIPQKDSIPFGSVVRR